MKLLVVGGAGYVGRMVIPHLAKHHDLRVFDLVKPLAGPWECVIGSVVDVEALASSMDGVDAVIYMAMYVPPILKDVRTIAPSNIMSVATAFDVHVKGLYLALWAASDRSVPHLVYTSSLSVYKSRDDHYPDELTPPDATDLYGFTKRLGEEVCRSWVEEGSLTVTALRLCFPVPDDAPAPTENNFRAMTFTRAYDVAQAILAGLEHRSGFDAFAISGDVHNRMVTLSKARTELGWIPTRPVGIE